MASLAPRLGDLGWRLREWRENWQPSPALRSAAGLMLLLALGAVCGAAIALAGPAAALVLLSLFLCVLCVRDFRFGAVLLIVIMPISSSYMFPHEMFGITGLNPLNLLLAATLASFVMRYAGTKSAAPFVPRKLLWLYVVPLVVAGLMGTQHVREIPGFFRDTDMIFFSEPVGYLRDMMLKPLFLVLYALLVGAAVAKSERPERFVTPLLLSVWAMAGVVLGFTLYAGVSLSSLAGVYARQFFSAIGMHANDLGRLYAVAYALLLFVWDRSANPLHKFGLFLSMGAVVLALLLTFSRGAFLGFILVNVIYLFSRRQSKVLLLALVAVPLAIYLMPGAVTARVEMGWGQGANAVTAGRVQDIWLPLMPELLDHPILGSGLGSVMWAQAMIREEMFQVGHPHNAYLQAWLDMGAVGLVLLLSFWIWTWRGFRALARDPRLHRELQGFFEGAAAGLLSFLVAGVAGSSLEPVPEQAFLWLAAGMMFGMRAKLASQAPCAPSPTGKGS